MGYVVRKPFNTTHQRFRLGVPVSKDDNLAPLNFDDLKERGFIGEETAAVKAEATVEAPAKAPFGNLKTRV